MCVSLVAQKFADDFVDSFALDKLMLFIVLAVYVLRCESKWHIQLLYIRKLFALIIQWSGFSSWDCIHALLAIHYSDKISVNLNIENICSWVQMKKFCCENTHILLSTLESVGCVWSNVFVTQICLNNFSGEFCSIAAILWYGWNTE